MEANRIYLAALFVLCNSAMVFGRLAPPAGPRRLHHDVADSFKVIQSFSYAVAVVDSDNDTFFNCWTAERKAINNDARTATYEALFPVARRAVPFYVKAEQNSPKFTFTLDDDPTPKEGVFHYTDYENCVVEDIEYHKHQCVLWVRKELKNSVPQNCIDYYVDICGVGVPIHSRDLCRDE
ncbi:uncharacterized protein LOC119384913 [Rhipicephalus sanguineus]|uniref:uncharacterized protein LOC119384913 n=1 Tax=Rhipicephalus sanguineus TaxID=34632 RepID=UPI0018949596|nr:uncharacterized protein LOC119384913 [Rhipicephalus sanguineus]